MSKLLQNDWSAEWRTELRKNIKTKDRTFVPRVEMPALDADVRNKNYEEVNCGLELKEAQLEASRCLDCKDPGCVKGCPVQINIPHFIKLLEKGALSESAQVLKQTSALPAVCGRVCPQEKQCEALCIYPQKLNKPAVAIGYLERFVADSQLKQKTTTTPIIEKNNIKVAVVGSGPSGLSCAGSLANLGYKVTVFEALHEIGGVLKYGIPEFRLPNITVDAEIEALEQLGVNFVTNCIVGKTISFENLEQDGFKAFFVGSGAGLPRFMHIEGENLVGVMSANEYLTRINLMGAGRSPVDTPVLNGKNIAVIGGGNTAMDAVRTAKRMGAKRAMIVYRRGMDEMPARAEEIHHAKEEGIEFLNLYNPIEYLDDGFGRVSSMRVQKMELGEPDASGRRRPVAKPGATEDIDADLVIVAIGVSPNPIIPAVMPDLKTSDWGTILVNKENLQSDVENIFAGGDIVRGGATVILAMGDGKKAAESIHTYLSK